jgi:hypothetical protein
MTSGKSNVGVRVIVGVGVSLGRGVSVGLVVRVGVPVKVGSGVDEGAGVQLGLIVGEGEGSGETAPLFGSAAWLANGTGVTGRIAGRFLLQAVKETSAARNNQKAARGKGSKDPCIRNIITQRDFGVANSPGIIWKFPEVEYLICKE